MKKIYFALTILCGINSGFLFAQDPTQEVKKYQHLIMYGQSFSTGSQSYPAISVENVSGNYMIGNQVWIEQGNDNSDKLSPLVGSIAQNNINEPLNTEAMTMAETPLLGVANHLQRKQGNEDINYIATTVGEPGKSIEALSKENSLANKTNYYNDYFIKAIDKAARIAGTENAQISSPAIFWMQGEWNYREIFDEQTPVIQSTSDKNHYLNLLVKLKNDMQADIMNKYKQGEKPVFITYQSGSLEFDDKVTIGNAQVEASNIYEDIICAGPTYQMPHRQIHLDPNGYRWYGEMLGKVYYHTQILKNDFKPLQPKRIYRIEGNAKKIGIEFLVPKEPLVFDTNTVPGVPNYGFKVKLNGIEQSINSVEISGNQVIITCNSDLNGTVEVNYGSAITTFQNEYVSYKSGNLRDSDDYPAFFNYIDLDEKNPDGTYVFDREAGKSLRPVYEPKDDQGNIIYNQRYPLYNFCVAFEYDLDAAQNEVKMPGFLEQGEILYVKKGENGDGSSWENPLGEFADALKIANQQNIGQEQKVKQIWVSSGTYTPKYRSDNLSGNNPLDRNNSFVLPQNVEIYGGFSGNEVQISDRDWKTNVTILSGDLIGNDGANFSYTEDNAYHVISSANNIGSTLLDGFTITGGNANHSNWERVYVNGGFVFQNCGGGMYLSGSSPKLNNLIITNNQANTSGGGIRLDGANPVLTNVVIKNNIVTNTNQEFGGAGIYNNMGSITLINNLLYKNQATGKGGGIYNERGTSHLINVTLADNSATSGRGIYNDNLSTLEVKNSIIWGNGLSNTESLGNSQYSYSLIEGLTSTTNNNIDGNIDPIFINNSEENYQLANFSPVINKGNNSFISNTDTDLNGNTRIHNEIVDLGAYEAIEDFDNRIWYVKENNTGNGSSWEDALGDLQDAINKANSGDEIWVAQGTYLPTRRADNLNVITLNDRNNAFVLKGNVKIYGGFQGNETKLSQRKKWRDYPSVLSGDLGTQNNVNDNAYHVVISSGNVGSTTLDGFTIEGGNANDPNWATLNVKGFDAFKNLGGGAYILLSSPTFKNLIITNNQALSSGGGIRLDATDPNAAHTIITHSIISNNRVTANNLGGAGIYNNKSTLTLRSVLLYGNQSAGRGGGIYNEGATTNLINATLSTNQSSVRNNGGGGLFNDANSFIQVQNSIIWGNGNSNIVNSGAYAYFNSIAQNLTTNDEHGNILGSTNPNFENSSTGNFRLKENSPLIDKGNNEYVIDFLSTDLDNKPRIINNSVDLGSYEFGDGCDWGDAVLEDTEVTYNGNPQVINLTTLPDNTDVIYTYKGIYPTIYTESEEAPVKAGQYEVTATLSSTITICETTLTAILTIQKAPSEIISDEIQTFNYGGIKSVVASLNHNETILNYYPQQEYSHVGNYSVIISVPETENYLADSLTVNLIIEDKVNFPGISFNNSSFTYNGNSHGIYLSEIPPQTTVTYSNNIQTNAGNYTATATLRHNNGYETTYSANLIINKAEAIITADDIQKYTYDGNAKEVAAALNHDKTTLIFYPEKTYTNAGVYPVSIIAPETDNYLGATKEISFIIEKKDFLSLVFNGSTVTYDGKAHSIYISSEIPEMEKTIVTYHNNNQTIAGIYTVVATLSNPNYNDYEISAILTIQKAQSIITAEEVQTHVYDGKEKSPEVKLNHDEANLFYEPGKEYINAGNYLIKVSIPETQNYLETSKEINFIIEKAVITDVSLEDKSVVYNKNPQPAEITGVNPTGVTLTYEYEGIPPTTYPKSSLPPKNAGTYKVTADFSSVNYYPLLLNANLTINKAPSVITAQSTQNHTYDGNQKNITASLNHDETTLNYSPQRGYVNQGSYEITVSAIETENYFGIEKIIRLVINKNNFTGVSLRNKTISYNKEPQSVNISGIPPAGTTVTYEYEGIPPTIYSISNNPPTNAGDYRVTATLINPNYNTRILNSNLKINKAVATITAEDTQEYINEGEIKNVVATLNHDETSLIYDPQQGYSSVGKYLITVTAPETDNYLEAPKKEIILIISPGLGVDDPTNNIKSIKIAPNPVSTILKVFFAEPATSKTPIILYDLMGKLILKEEVIPGDMIKEIDFRNLYPGTYILKYKNTSMKIIKE